jgi:hypothetical protein
MSKIVAMKENKIYKEKRQYTSGICHKEICAGLAIPKIF